MWMEAHQPSIRISNLLFFLCEILNFFLSHVINCFLYEEIVNKKAVLDGQTWINSCFIISKVTY
jgi:hypothetical protein